MNIDLTETYNKVKELNIKSGKNEPKFIIFTMGCQQNENDSQKIAGMLKNAGYSKTEDPAEAEPAGDHRPGGSPGEAEREGGL